MARSRRKNAGNYFFNFTGTTGKDPPQTPVKEKVFRKEKKKGINANPVLPTLADQASLNTPFKDKPAGNPLLRVGTQPTNTGYTQKALELELDEEVVYDAHTEDLLGRWFPEARLPLTVDKVLAGLTYTEAQLKLGKPENGVYYNADTFEWANFPLDHENYLPKGSTVEDELAKYMQAVADFSARYLTRNPDAVRKCTGKYSNLTLKSDVSGIKRKPDILWVDQDVRIVNEDTAEDDDDDENDDFNADATLKHLNWKFVAAVGEIKLLKWKLRGRTFIMKFAPELNDRTFAIFEAQDNRRFVPSFGANGVLFRLCHGDRGGSIYSSEFNVFVKPRNFVHLIVGLAYASDECVGYDPTILRMPVENPTGPGSLETILPLNDAEMERLANTIEGLEIPKIIPIPLVPIDDNVATSSGLSPAKSPNKNTTRRLRPRKNITAPARTPTFTTNASSIDAQPKKKRRRKKKKKKAPLPLSGCPRLAAIDTEDDYTRYIIVAGYLYEIRGSVYRRVMIQGRATQCWLVVRDGKEYIIVDKWVSPYRVPTEVDLLLLAQGIVGVPKLVDWEDVVIGQRLDTCNNNRGVHLKLVNRVHRRLVFEDFCRPIYFFRSLRELVSAFRDYLITHKGLYLINILHRDITIFNMLLKANGGKLREGVLSDYDYAWDDDEIRRLNYKIPEVGKSNLPDKVVMTERVDSKAVDSRMTTEILEVNTPATVEPKSASINTIKSKSILEGDSSVQGPSSSKQTSRNSATLRREEELERMLKGSKDIAHSIKGDRTGMRLFVSGELLDDRTIKPTIYHDFESFEYNLLFLTFMFKGPEDDQIETGLPPILEAWIHAENMDEETAAFTKKGWFGQSEDSFEKKLNYVTPYMSPLKPLLRKIHFFLSGPRDKINHDSFIEIFDWALKELDLDGENSAASDSEPHESTDPSDPGPSSPAVPGAPETQLLELMINDPIAPPSTIIDNTSTFPMPLVPRITSAVAYPNVWVPVRIPLPIRPVSVRQSRHFVRIFDDQFPGTDD